jgi:hypothetical protein
MELASRLPSGASNFEVAPRGMSLYPCFKLLSFVKLLDLNCYHRILLFSDRISVSAFVRKTFSKKSS